jgi:hypothetical protein
MPIMSKSFHNLVDSARAYQNYTSAGAWKQFPPYITIRQRSLTYQMFPHFHPYVGGTRAALPNVTAGQFSLIQRLNEGGVDELQDSDTLYMPQPNPRQNPSPLAVQPGSTRATLTSTVTATRPSGGASLSLPAGTPLTLPDGVQIKVPAGTVIADAKGGTTKLSADLTSSLPGEIPVLSARGIQVIGTDNIIPDYTVVTLPGGAASAVLTNDGSWVNLPNDTSVAIRSGIPQPFFYETIFDNAHYDPTSYVTSPFPVKNIDFTYDGAYSIYNWELFFHAPLLIAIHLSQNGQYQDAQNWFHYIFNPTDNSPGPTPQRFWKVQPFQYSDVQMIEQILVNLSTGQDVPLQTATVQSIAEWMKNPFQPWAVAQYRPTALMLKTVTAYLDNLIAWGDSLFRAYTIETINEATELYIMAANILGTKPQPVPKVGSVNTLTYNQLRGKLDAFGNTLVDMEVDMPFDIVNAGASGSAAAGTRILASIGQTLYFCIPQNDQLLTYWDTVADRLFKIHNSLNLQGIFQRPPLYDPPIDPALLVRAAASGLDVSSVVSGLNQPLPLIRFQVLMAKATEIVQEVKSLGANLLSTLEKQDNESLSLLRAQHENNILSLSQMVKYSQWQEAQKSTQALKLTLATAVQRYTYYQKLLGRTDSQISSSVPDLGDLDLPGLQNYNFTQSDMTAEPQMTLDAIVPDISQDATSVSDGEVKTLTNNEVKELRNLDTAHDFQIAASASDAIGAVLAVIPQIEGNVEPMGCGASVGFGGQQLHSMMSSLSSIARLAGEQFSYEATNAGKIGSYSRRELEWTFQGNSAKAEINQILKQTRGAQIREAIAKKEYDNHLVQMEHAQQIVDFLEGNDVDGFQTKETTIGFYNFLKRELKTLYNNAFQLAFKTAKKAERALQNELGDPSLAYIQYNYLDGTEGLLAGEKLLFDLKTMEMAYQDLNQREYELTKHVSLLQIDPLALVHLRATGTCTFTLPEEAFDLDGPGHYFRRIKSVALTLPCVAGPYTSVNCTLTLQKSTIRTRTGLHNNKYARQGSDDPRFNDYYGTIQSIVTSSAQSDSGLFETNLKDERYLPFEESGVAGSQWQLSLPADVPQFDFDTITDAILHVRYTAREGGAVQKAAAVGNLQSLISKAHTVGSTCLFSIRHEFPSQWAKFQSAAPKAGAGAQLQLTFVPELYPFWSQAPIAGQAPKPIKITGVQFFAQMLTSDKTATVNISDKADMTNNDALTKNPSIGNLLNGPLNKIGLPSAITDATHPPLTIYFDDNSMEDLWMAVSWGT